MKDFLMKFMFAVLTFFVGVSVVGFCYLKRLDAANRRALPQTFSAVAPVKLTVENPCDYPTPKDRDITAEEAVYLAECFVIQNGYTDLPPLADRRQLTPENVFPLIDEEGLKMRRNSLERKAYSYERDQDFWGGSWIVAFHHASRPKDCYNGKCFASGRAVVMNFFGKKIRLMHSPYPLTMPSAMIINP